MKRRCPRCGRSKRRGLFHKNKTRPGNISIYCKRCTADCQTKYTALQQHDFYLKSKFGISLCDYEKLLKKQRGRCAICRTATPGTNTIHFAVDHCHKTGMIRGLLCQKCNRGLGHFDDRPKLFDKAAEYLRKANGNNHPSTTPPD